MAPKYLVNGGPIAGDVISRKGIRVILCAGFSLRHNHDKHDSHSIREPYDAPQAPVRYATATVQRTDERLRQGWLQRHRFQLAKQAFLNLSR
jgi:hypothetical protein